MRITEGLAHAHVGVMGLSRCWYRFVRVMLSWYTCIYLYRHAVSGSCEFLGEWKEVAMSKSPVIAHIKARSKVLITSGTLKKKKKSQLTLIWGEGVSSRPCAVHVCVNWCWLWSFKLGLELCIAHGPCWCGTSGSQQDANWEQYPNHGNYTVIQYTQYHTKHCKRGSFVYNVRCCVAGIVQQQV